MEVDSGPVTNNVDIKKRKRAPKNRKKYWKKQCSITDVEEFLNDERLQKKAGGPVSEKPNDALFFVDSKTNKQEKSKTATQRRKERIARARCYTSLEPDPNTEPVAVRRTQGIKVGSKKYIRKSNAEIRRLGRATQVQADIQRAEVLTKRREKKKEIDKQRVEGASTNHYYGLWAEPEPTPPMIDEEFIEHTKPKPIKPPGHYFFKPSRLSAIEVAHPGASYNPSHQDHQNLLRDANIVEEKRERSAAKLAKQTYVKKLPRNEIEKNWMEEMSSGLFDDKSTTIDDVTHSVGSLSSTAVGPTQTLKRRTKAARRRELAENKRIQRIKKVKKFMNSMKDIYKLKSMKVEIEGEEGSHRDKLRRRRSMRHSRLDHPKRLGPNKYVPPDHELKLSTELRGSLRLLKPEGDIMRDRFKSFQKRNILRATLKAKRIKVLKKNRPKIVEKREMREVTL